MQKIFVFTSLLCLVASQATNAQNNTFPTPSGNVGIGTTSPQQQLHVVGTSLFSGTSVIDGGNQLRFWSATDGPYFTESFGIRAYPHYNSHAFMILNQPLFVGYQADGADLDNDDGSLMVSNRMGIGTKTPTRKLSLNSPDATTLVDFGLYQDGVEKAAFGAVGAANEFFTGTVAGDLAIRATTGKLHLGANPGTFAPAATILQNGNFGLGTTTPDENFTIRYTSPGNVGGFAMRNLNNTSLFSLNTDQSGSGYITAYHELVLSTNFYAIVFKPLGQERMRISHTGNIGIGTNDPQHTLDVNGNFRTGGFILQPNAGAGKVLTSDANGNASWQTASGGSSQWTTNSNDIHFSNGNVGIGTTNLSGYRLAVNGDALFTKIKVKQYLDWPDYVFDAGYSLRSLTDLEKFIKRNNHLPDVPSAAEVQEKGFDVADNQAVLLKKIEELTLYIIELNKRLEKVETEH